MILSAWLRKTGRTIDGFASEIGKTRQTVHRYLNGSRFPKRSVIKDIERISDGQVSAEDWFSPRSEAAE